MKLSTFPNFHFPISFDGDFLMSYVRESCQIHDTREIYLENVVVENFNRKNQIQIWMMVF